MIDSKFWKILPPPLKKKYGPKSGTPFSDRYSETYEWNYTLISSIVISISIYLNFEKIVRFLCKFCLTRSILQTESTFYNMSRAFLFYRYKITTRASNLVKESALNQTTSPEDIEYAWKNEFACNDIPGLCVLYNKDMNRPKLKPLRPTVFVARNVAINQLDEDTTGIYLMSPLWNMTIFIELKAIFSCQTAGWKGSSRLKTEHSFVDSRLES